MKKIKFFKSLNGRKKIYKYDSLFYYSDKYESSVYNDEYDYDRVKSLFFNGNYNALNIKISEKYDIDAFIQTNFSIKKNQKSYLANFSAKHIGKRVYNVMEEKDRNFLNYLIESKNKNKSFRSFFNLYMGYYVIKENFFNARNLLFDIENINKREEFFSQIPLSHKNFLAYNFYKQVYSKMSSVICNEFRKKSLDAAFIAVLVHFLTMRKLFFNAININNKIKYFKDLPIYNSFGLLKECDYSDEENFNESSKLQVGLGFLHVLDDMEETEEYLKKYFLNRYLDFYNRIVLKNFINIFFLYSKSMRLNEDEINCLIDDFENYANERSKKFDLTKEEYKSLKIIIDTSKYFLASIIDILISYLPKFLGFVIISKNYLDESQLEKISSNDFSQDLKDSNFLAMPFINIDFSNKEYKKIETFLKYFNSDFSEKITSENEKKNYKSCVDSLFNLFQKIKIEDSYIVNKSFEILCDEEKECEEIKKAFEKYYKRTSEIENIVKKKIDSNLEENEYKIPEDCEDFLKDFRDNLKIDLWENVKKNYKNLVPEKEMMCFQLFDDLFNFYYNKFLPPSETKENFKVLENNINKEFSITCLFPLKNVESKTRICYYENGFFDDIFKNCIFVFQDVDKYFNFNDSYETHFTISSRELYCSIVSEKDDEALTDPFKRFIIENCFKLKRGAE